MSIRSRTVIMAVLGAIMVLTTIATLKSAAIGFQFDFKGDLYGAAHAILHGQNPYRPAAVQAEANILAHGGSLVGWSASPRYPPLLMLAVVPLSLLSLKLAGFLYMAISIGAVILGLRLLGIRDWRCITIAVVSAPAMFGSWIGNVSTLLLLGVGLIWHVRERPRLLPAISALVIGAKLFLWPIGAWMLVTRRYRQLALTVPLTLFAILASWAVIDFHGLSTYPKMLVNVAYIGELRGSSLVTALLNLGLSTTAARAGALLVTALLVAAAWRMAGRHDGDQRALGLVTVAALVASPVVWLHSMVLLFVPIALLSPRLSPLWFIPTVAGFSPTVDVLLESIVVAALCLPLLSSPAWVADQLLERPRWRASRLRARLRPVALMLLTPM